MIKEYKLNTLYSFLALIYLINLSFYNKICRGEQCSSEVLEEMINESKNSKRAKRIYRKDK